MFSKILKISICLIITTAFLCGCGEEKTYEVEKVESNKSVATYYVV